VLGDRLLDQLLLQRCEIDGWNVHQDDRGVGEPVLEIERRPLRLDHLGADLLHRERLGKNVGPCWFGRHDQYLRRWRHVEDDPIAVVLRKAIAGPVDNDIIARTPRHGRRHNGFDAAAPVGKIVPMHSKAKRAANGTISANRAWDAPKRPLISVARNAPRASAAKCGSVIMVSPVNRERLRIAKKTA
jgi:hypothetical protein